MKRGKMFGFFGCWLGLALAVCAQEPVTQVFPADNGRGLINPGMGWVFHHYDNSLQGYGKPLGPAYDGSDFPGLGVVYLRLAWAYLEPQEGQYNWALLDTPAQRYIQRGGQFALRITASESEMTFAAPRWVMEAGAKGHWWKWGKGVVDPAVEKDALWEPDYGDPVFLAKLERFLKALGRRYDGNPNLAFVDVGTYGLWGEGHRGGSGLKSDTRDIERHVDLHRQAFARTLLVAMDDWEWWNGAMARFGQAGQFEQGLLMEVGPDLWGQRYELKLALHKMKRDEKVLPADRFAPEYSSSDGRMLLGEVSIDANGETTFQAADHNAAPAQDAVWGVRAGQLFKRGRSWVLPLTWTVHQPMGEPGTFDVTGDLEQNGQVKGQVWISKSFSPLILYCYEQGLTLRDDSILWDKGKTYDSQWMVNEIWPVRPTILEMGHYEYVRDRGGWQPEVYREAMWAYHASFLSVHAVPALFYKENKDLVDRMGREMGYRLQLTMAQWPQVIEPGGQAKIHMQWCNAGTAPCLAGGYPALTLKDQSGAIVAVLIIDGLNMRELEVRLDVNQPVPLRNLDQTLLLPEAMPCGELDVFVSVGSLDGTPSLALPLDGDDGHKRYHLGKLTVKAQAQ